MIVAKCVTIIHLFILSIDKSLRLVFVMNNKLDPVANAVYTTAE